MLTNPQALGGFTVEQFEAELRSTAAGRDVLKCFDKLAEARTLEELGTLLLTTCQGNLDSAERSLSQAQVAGRAPSTARARSSVAKARRDLAHARTKLAGFRSNRGRVNAALMAAAEKL